MTESTDVQSPATDDKRKWEGYINGLIRAGNFKPRVTRDDNGSRVLNDIRAQIDDKIAWAKAQATWIADDSQDDTYSPQPTLKIP